MSVMKELWFQAREQLENELGRSPTCKEVDSRSADILAGLIDEGYEIAREAGLRSANDFIE